jgi:hypothetical protein
MTADPKPNPRIAFALGDGTIFQGDSDRIKIRIAMKWLEIQRRMVWIFLKNSKGFFRGGLNFFWQSPIQIPKSRFGF